MIPHMDISPRIPYIVIVFQNELKTREIPLFRGAVLSKVPVELTLFHNHKDKSFRFSYPLIQYKTISGKAAILCLGEGTSEIEQFFSNSDFKLQIGKREEVFTIDKIWAGQWLIQTWDGTFYYTTRHWLPFNKTNYSKYQGCEGLSEKTKALERILAGNILSMGKGLGHFFESQVQCTITQLYNARTYSFKDVLLQGYDIDWKTNLYIPNHIGLGKGSSIGFGVTRENNTQRYERHKR